MNVTMQLAGRAKSAGDKEKMPEPVFCFFRQPLQLLAWPMVLPKMIWKESWI
jgi:hypothetical protein